MLKSLYSKHPNQLYNTFSACCLLYRNVETVTGDPATGDLLLPDKWGNVYLAQRMPNGSYTLQQPPLARMGPGRVLGSKLDAQGNLIMCDVLKVSGPTGCLSAICVSVG